MQHGPKRCFLLAQDDTLVSATGVLCMHTRQIQGRVRLGRVQRLSERHLLGGHGSIHVQHVWQLPRCFRLCGRE